MAKSKREKNYSRKPVVSTAAIFGKAASRKLITKLQRQEKAFRSNTAKHLHQAKDKAKLQSRRKQEHVLSTEFSEHIDKYQHNVDGKYSSAVEQANQELSNSLTNAAQQRHLKNHEAKMARRQRTRSLDADEMDWQSSDVPESGSTSIGKEIKLLGKSFSSGKQKCTFDQVQWTVLNNALHLLIRDLYGHEAYEHLEAEANKMPIYSNEELTVMQQEVEAEKDRVMKLVAKENTRALNDLRAAEKAYVDKQEDIIATERSLSALFRDDEYS